MSENKDQHLKKSKENPDDVEFYTPRNRLAEVIRSNSGHTLKEMEFAAEQRIRKLGENYPDLVKKAVEDMKAYLASDAPFKERLDNIFMCAHDLKGQAATFGYKLVGEVGKSLCAAIRAVPDLLEKEQDILQLHINAISWALQHEHDDKVATQKSELINSLHESIKKGL
jgi:HPt (histidine-containing phosphotransfer) domain-containing protein